jgi:hypothetical protein
MDWLYTLIIIVVVVWLAGLLLKIGGRFIHLLLMIALVMFLLRLLNIV